jgi:replication-associated recombination protein RarA
MTTFYLENHLPTIIEVSAIHNINNTQIDIQPLIDVQSSNPCLISTSQTSVPQIYVLFQILKSVSNSQIYVLFQICKLTSNDVTDLCQNNNPNPNQQLDHRSENLERTLIWVLPLIWICHIFGRLCTFIFISYLRIMCPFSFQC